MYRYLVTTKGDEPFFTQFFTPENHFVPDGGMVVYDLVDRLYTDDGEEWFPIEVDRL